MQKQIEEVMALIDQLIGGADFGWRGGEQGIAIESKLRELAQIPEGFVLVPVEPTMPMLKEAQRVDGYHGPMNEWLQDEGRDFIAMYRAAIEAAPKEPTK